MLRILNLKLSIEKPETQLKQLAAKALRLAVDEILSLRIEKKSLDARPKHDGSIHFIYSVDVEVADEDFILSLNLPNVKKAQILSYNPPKKVAIPPAKRPIVVGAGPAGLAAGLLLAEAGYNPLIIEQGEAIEQRVISVKNFSTATLKENSNIQFGEGGAAVFSAGLFRKFVKDERIVKLINDFKLTPAVRDSDFYSEQTFLGSDIVFDVIVNIKKRILTLGGEFLYETQVNNLLVAESTIKGVTTSDNQEFASDHVIFATGISARSVYELLRHHHVELIPMPFAVGLRIEHPKEVINKAQYRACANHLGLKPAGYNLNHKTASGRTVYPFAISPAGQVIPSPSEKETLIVSGTTTSARNYQNTNSAIVVQLNSDDFESNDIFAGLDFRQKLEQKAFELGGGSYKAPAQLVGDFINNRPSTALGSVTPSYPHGVTLCNLHDLLPDFVCAALVEAITVWGNKIVGFDMADAVLTGVESRASSLMRIVRCKETMQSVSLNGLYVAGDGAGYAAGIISSYVDGIRVAEAVIASYQNSK